MLGQIPTVLVVAVLAGHFVADFVMQSDEMATKKSSSFRWLSIHVAVYAVGLALNTVCLLWGTTLGSWLTWLGANVALHWLTDSVTSRWTARLYKAGERHWFFVVIGLDQLIHTVTLLTTLSYLLN